MPKEFLPEFIRFHSGSLIPAFIFVLTGRLELFEAIPRVFEVELPAGVLTRGNVLTFGLPDAASPRNFGIDADECRLGIAV